MAAAFLLATLGLLLGGRIYFVTFIMVLAVFRSVFVRPLPRSAVLAAALAGAVGVAVVGLVRFDVGRSPLSLSNMAWSVVLEPMFTAFSLLDFLAASRLELFNWPVMLLSQLVNLVPSAVVPNKLDLMVTPEELGYSTSSPFGALSGFVSLTVNFGALGTLPVLFGASLWLTWLRARQTVLSQAIYAMVCGFIPFSFFRDPFYTSVVKSILQFGVIVPIAVFGLLQLVRLGLARSSAGTPPLSRPRDQR
jgi:hypothetical protein